MKRLLAVIVVGALAAPSAADVYTDTAGDVFTGAGGGILDILSVEVTNDLTDITFTFTLAGDVNAADWGKYLIMFDTVPGGDTTVPIGNPWNRPITMAEGADLWIGTWTDWGGGAQLWDYTGSWNLLHSTPSPNISFAFGGTSVSVTTRLADMGLAVHDTFCFDAFTSGADGDPGAIDSLGNPMQQIGDWGEHSFAHVVCYTVVPEPTTMGLLALGAAALIRRRRSAR